MVHFGDAGKTFLIEECIQNHDGTPGEEASFYTITDGTNFYTFKTSQDHKAIGMFDEGPNTGGMGVISPARVIPDNLVGVIEDTIICPAIDGLRAEGRPYVGVLYTGVMVTYTVDGQPEVKVVEFNARWGAPEAEVVVPGILTPMDEIAFACINGGLNKLIIEEDDLVRVGITGASRGYPGDYSAVKGKRIFGLEEAMAAEGVSIYGAGIKKEGTNVGPIFKANGGRLFTLVGEGETIIEAREKAFKGMAQIHVDGNNLVWRTDIGHHDIQRYYEGGNNDNMDTNTRRKS